MTVQATSAALAPASIGARVIAYIIDAIILGIVGILVVGAIVSDSTVTGSLTRAIIYAVLGFLYFGYTWTAWRASPGQRILGLMTVNADGGGAMSWNTAIVRWGFLFGPSVVQSLFSNQLGSGLGALVGLVVLAYYIYLLYTAATDSRRQGFHDKQAGTLVTTKAAAV
jgi:uncharacterized RDD family membrane protein YckC